MIKQSLQAAVQYGMGWMDEGKVANYIPELAKVQKEKLAVCVTQVDGSLSLHGDCDVQFTMQSISKLITLCAALDENCFEIVFEKVGMEPTGDPFNSIIRLETMKNTPLNPMINAGAIAVISCIKGDSKEEILQKIFSKAKIYLGVQDIGYDRKVLESEAKTGDRNRALAYMMKSNKVFDNDVEDLLDIYFKACSILVSAKEISYFGAILANKGVDLFSNKVIIDPFTVKILCSLMTTCGMYDASGEFALRVGIPSKSGVAGGILSAVPGKMGIGVYSPGLDAKGNSLCGAKVLEHLSNTLNLSIF